MDNQTVPKISHLEKLFVKYEFLVYGYANKMFDYEYLGFDKDDVVQELRVKLYTSLLTYLKRWKEYRTTGRRKPMPAYYYLRTCLISYVNDMIKRVKKTQEFFVQENSGSKKNSAPTTTRHADLGTHNPNVVQIDLGAAKLASINGVDLFGGLTGLGRSTWVLFLKGYKPKEISRFLKTRLASEGLGAQYVDRIIKQQREYLLGVQDELQLENLAEYRVQEILED